MEIKKGRFEKETNDEAFYLKDPQLFELYKRCLPPKEAYYYFPKGNEIIEYNEKKPKKSYRKIYSDTQYFDYEKQMINDYKQIINNHPEVKVPNYIDDAYLLRLIYADDCNLEVAFKRLVKYIEWSNKTFPIIIPPKSKYIEMLNKGFVYAYGRDHRFRPILVFRLKEFSKIEKMYSVQEVIEAGCFLGQFIVNNMMIPGKIERWNLIINLRGSTLLSLPDHIKKLIPVMNEAFISRLHKNYIIGMTFILRLLYKVVCAFLHESTIKKIKILGGKKDQGLFEEIRKDNVEEDMGGIAPNVKIGEENALFPPRMPSEHFLLETERPENLLISEDEYIQKYKNGEIDDDFMSPYILEKLNINNNKNSNDEIHEIIEMPKTEIIQKSKTISDIPSKNMIKLRESNIINEEQNKINNEKYNQIQKMNQLREQNIHKVKSFVYHGWDFRQENNINEEKYKIPNYNGNTIINDFYSLANKRNKFFSKISKISNKTNTINSRMIYSFNGNI